MFTNNVRLNMHCVTTRFFHEALRVKPRECKTVLTLTVSLALYSVYLNAAHQETQVVIILQPLFIVLPLEVVHRKAPSVISPDTNPRALLQSLHRIVRCASRPKLVSSNPFCPSP